MAEAEPVRVLEFVELRGDPALRDGALVIAGKCVVGPIRVGDRFSRLVDALGNEHDVKIGVVDIGFYGGYVFELDPALAGELVLVGECETELLAGATLFGLNGGGFDL